MHFRWGLEKDQMCQFCGDDVNDTTHLFLPHITMLWEEMAGVALYCFGFMPSSARWFENWQIMCPKYGNFTAKTQQGVLLCFICILGIF